MPTNHWAIIDIVQTITAAGVQIVVTTNVPCHLYMRWTIHEPRIHSKAILTRGLATKTDVRFCFTVFEDNEQEEAGDTLVHTFIKEPWAVCETRYFYFHGTITGIASPSTTAIFTFHRTAPPPPTIYYPDPGIGGTSVDGGVANLTLFQSFSQSRDGAGTNAWPLASVYMCRMRVSGAAAPNNWYEFARFISLFDLSPGLGHLVLSAKFYVWGLSKVDTAGKNPQLTMVSSNPALNNNLIPADYQALGATPFSSHIPYAAFNINAWNTFTLNGTGLAYINSAMLSDGIVKLGIREHKYDLLNVNPFPFLRNRMINFFWEDVDHPGGHKPYLEVTWT